MYLNAPNKKKSKKKTVFTCHLQFSVRDYLLRTLCEVSSKIRLLLSHHHKPVKEKVTSDTGVGGAISG